MRPRVGSVVVSPQVHRWVSSGTLRIYRVSHHHHLLYRSLITQLDKLTHDSTRATHQQEDSLGDVRSSTRTSESKKTTLASRSAGTAGSAGAGNVRKYGPTHPEYRGVRSIPRTGTGIPVTRVTLASSLLLAPAQRNELSPTLCWN